MTCKLCPKIAFYQVPKTEHFYCEAHKGTAEMECRKQLHERDRPHYMDRVGIYQPHALRAG